MYEKENLWWLYYIGNEGYVIKEPFQLYDYLDCVSMVTPQHAECNSQCYKRQCRSRSDYTKTQGIAIAMAVASSACKNWHFVISLSLVKIYTWKLQYVFTIQKAIHAIKGHNSECILFRIMHLFQLALYILYQTPHSQALAPACGSLVFYKQWVWCSIIWLLLSV